MESLVTRQGTRAALQVEGDIVASTVPELRIQLRALLLDGVQDLVFDLSRTRMVDSAGIGLLMAALNSVHKSGGTISVIHASVDIGDLFKTMRLDQHLKIADD